MTVARWLPLIRSLTGTFRPARAAVRAAGSVGATALAKFTTKEFSKALRSLVDVPSQIARPLADGIAKFIDSGFSAGTDSYGRPWAPLMPRTLAKGRHPPPLTETHAMRDSAQVRPSQGGGVSVVFTDSKAGLHQHGDPPRMVAREVLPVNTLPAPWRALWQSLLTEATKRRLSSGR